MATSQETAPLDPEDALAGARALRSLADRMESEDFRWVVQAIEIQRDVGGDLAEVLDGCQDLRRGTASGGTS